MDDFSPPSTTKLALSWSGGKDSALALWALRTERKVGPDVLITTVTETYGRVSMHGVRRDLLLKQAQLVGVPVLEVPIPAGCSDALYERRVAAAFASGALTDVDVVASGDLFLEHFRAYRETRLGALGRRALFPLWGRDTAELARRFISAGFEAVIVSVDPRKLDPSFAGRSFDADFLKDLPAGIDPCGENGEFHTFVHAGPIFSRSLDCGVGEVVERGGFVFCDVVEA